MDKKELCERLEPVLDLGTSTGKKGHTEYVGVTLNYSPKFMFPVIVNKRKKRCQWGCMTPDQQRDIFIEHVRDIYVRHFNKVIYSFELTKDGQLHCHLLGELWDVNPDHKEFDLVWIRKHVCQHAEVIRYTKGDYKKIIVSNYIHYVDKDKWSEYIVKDNHKIPYPTITEYINNNNP